MTKPPQARNSIKRALAYVAGLRFSNNYIKECKDHFNHSCAYCSAGIEQGGRRGHLDHAIAMTTDSPNYHLVYACHICNGDSKREQDWKSFLKEACKGDKDLIREREKLIEQWFEKSPPVSVSKESLKRIRTAEQEAITSFNAIVEKLKKTESGPRE